MLSAATSSMDPATFTSLPSSTNAVESLYGATKEKHPDVLKVILTMAYKVDMASALEHVAALKQIPTSYERLTPDVRTTRSKVAKRANAKRMHEKAEDEDADKQSNFSKHCSQCL